MEFRSSGASGDIYLAWDTRFNQRVHVTILPGLSRGADDDGALYHAFVDAMRGLSSLRHPAILAPTDFSSPASDEAWYASDQPQGESVSHLLRVLRSAPWRLVAQLMHEIAAALAFVHGRQLCHGQLTPDSIVVDRTGRVQVADLSVVPRVMLGQPGHAQLDLADLYDKLPYLPPEAQQRRAPDAEADMFALGVIGYELLVGERPFGTIGDVLSYAQARRSAPDPGDRVGDVPLELRRVVQALLASRRENRPRTAVVVRDALSALLREAGVTDVRGALRTELERRREIFGDAPAPPVPDAAQPEEADATAPRRDTQEVGVGVTTPGYRKPTQDLGPAHRVTEQRVSRAAGPETEELVSAKRDGRGPGTSIERLEANEARGRPNERRERPASWSAGVFMLAIVAAVMGGGWWLVTETAVGPDSRLRSAAQAEAAQESAEEEPTARTSRDEYEVDDEADDDGEGVTRLAVPQDPMEEAVAKARAMLASQRFADAEVFVRQGLEFAERSEADELNMLLAESQAGQGRVDDAVATWLDVDGRGGRRWQGHHQAGLLLAENARCGAAIPLLRAAVRRGDASVEAVTALGRCLLMTGDLLGAEEALLDARSKAPDRIDILLSLAAALEQTGTRDADALAAYSDALRVEPDNRAAQLGLVRLEVAGDNPEDAAARLLALAEGGDPDAEALGRTGREALGHAAFRARDYKEAATQYAAAVEQAGDEATPDLLRNLALALDYAGMRGAARAYKAAIQASPRDAELRHAYGRLLARAGDWSRAASVLEGAARLDPARWQALFDLGTASLGAGDASSAARAFGLVVRQRPNDQAALQNLGKAQIDGGNTEDAIQTFGRLATLRPADPQPVLTMAVLMHRMKRSEEAEALFASACRLGAQEACK